MAILISEVKRWAKNKGYIITKEKGDEEKGDPTTYKWYKITDPTIQGIATSVSKVATAVYNDISGYKWLEYQKNFKKVDKV